MMVLGDRQPFKQMDKNILCWLFFATLIGHARREKAITLIYLFDQKASVLLNLIGYVRTLSL